MSEPYRCCDPVGFITCMQRDVSWPIASPLVGFFNAFATNGQGLLERRSWRCKVVFL